MEVKMREEVLEALQSMKGSPTTAARIASLLATKHGWATDKSHEVGDVLAVLVQEGSVRDHCYPTASGSAPQRPQDRTLYWLPSSSAPSPRSPNMASTSTTPSTPSGEPSSPSKSNHLGSQMSSSLRSRLRGRRSAAAASPFKSPLKRKEPDGSHTEESKSPSSVEALEQPAAKHPKLESPKSHEAEKRELELSIKAKEAKLAELKRKRLLAEQKFSNQEEREKVPKLIAKWREVCQEVLVQLHTCHVQEKPDLTLAELVEYLNIDAAAIHFSAADETFY